LPAATALALTLTRHSTNGRPAQRTHVIGKAKQPGHRRRKHAV